MVSGKPEPLNVLPYREVGFIVGLETYSNEGLPHRPVLSHRLPKLMVVPLPWLTHTSLYGGNHFNRYGFRK